MQVIVVDIIIDWLHNANANGGIYTRGEAASVEYEGARSRIPGFSSVETLCFFFSSRRRHTRFDCDWSSDVCSSDLVHRTLPAVFLGLLTAQRPLVEVEALLIEGLRQHLRVVGQVVVPEVGAPVVHRSEERRVGKECRSRWSPYH